MEVSVSTILFVIIMIICIAIIAFIVFQPRLIEYRRNKIKHAKFPQRWDDKLVARWPLYRRLPDLLKQNLQERIKVFLSEKQFHGCNGLEITEDHKLFIAAQACLLIINKPFEHFDALHTLLIYPSAFIVKRHQLSADGTIVENRNINTGEAWQTGKIILSWDDAYSGMINITDGHNVVFHEFSHILDFTNGSANGAPFLQHAKNYEQWSRTFSSAYNRLQQSVSNHQKNIFDPYGATNPGEFFAVASELFFEKSQLFQNHEPELYEQLVQYYVVDPALW